MKKHAPLIPLFLVVNGDLNEVVGYDGTID